MNIEESINEITKSTPFIARLSSLVILLAGVVGFVFYTTILLFQLFDNQLLAEWGYNEYYGNSMLFILILQDVIHIGLLLSAVMLLGLQKRGYYIFIVTYFILNFLWYFVHGSPGWYGMGAGGLMILILTFYYKRLK